MATKAKAFKVIEEQSVKYGLQYEVELNDPYTLTVWLPEPLVWDNGYNTGMVTQEKTDDESWSEFWESLLAVIDSEVKS